MSTEYKDDKIFNIVQQKIHAFTVDNSMLGMKSQDSDLIGIRTQFKRKRF